MHVPPIVVTALRSSADRNRVPEVKRSLVLGDATRPDSELRRRI
jgi:hypothetical protein